MDYCTQGNPEGLVILNFNDVCSDDYWVIHFWWKKFLEDEAFYSQLKMRWKTLRQKEFSENRVNHLIDSISVLLNKAQVRNFQKWPVLGQYVWPNYYIGNTYSEEVSYLKNWVKNRLIYLDKVWEIKDSNVTEQENLPISIMPNPGNEIIQLKFTSLVPTGLQMKVVNSSGQLMYVPYMEKDQNLLELDIKSLATGVYFIQLTEDKQKRNIKFVKQ